MSDSILQVNQIKDKGGNATGITVADTTANVTINNLAGGAIGSAVTMSANQACVKTALNASGSAPIYACRAWVRFPSSSTITASGNVSSITDHAPGQFTVNFTTAMPDANYCVTMMSGDDSSSATLYGAMFGGTSSRTTSSFRFRIIRVSASSSATDDASYIGLAIFR